MFEVACVPDLVDLVRAAPARCGQTRLVCVDGPAGSGKTTLAAELSRRLSDAPVVHMDDLYEGWSQSLGESLAERVESWLLLPWQAGAVGGYQRYDWQAQRFLDSWTTVPPAPVVILEGCASASRRLRRWAALVVWVQAAPDVRLSRGLARDGHELSAQWRAWQVHERAHFVADGTRGSADVVVDGTSGSIVVEAGALGPE